MAISRNLLLDIFFSANLICDGEIKGLPVNFLKALILHQSFRTDNKLWTTKASHYFLTTSQAAFTFLTCRIHQAVIKWIHGDGSKNYYMVMLFDLPFIKGRVLENNQLSKQI